MLPSYGNDETYRDELYKKQNGGRKKEEAMISCLSFVTTERKVKTNAICNDANEHLFANKQSSLFSVLKFH